MTNLQAAYFGEFDCDQLLRRIQSEIKASEDPEMIHILAMSAAQITQVKARIAQEQKSKPGLEPVREIIKRFTLSKWRK